MRKYIHPAILMAACLATVTACIEDPVPEPEPVAQTANTWAFNGGAETKAGSVLICESSGSVTAYFSAREGLSAVQDFSSADDCTEITFPVSAVGSEINLATMDAGDTGTRVISRRPEFNEKNGFLIEGGSNSISEGKLSTKLVNGTLDIKCEFVTLGKNIRFSVYLQGELQHVAQTEPDGNYYKYNGTTVELKSVHAACAGEDGMKYFGIIASPYENRDMDDILDDDKAFFVTIDEMSLYNPSVTDPVTGKYVFDLTASLDTELEMFLIDGGNYLGFPDDPVSKGTITIYFTDNTDGSRNMHAEGDIVFADGKTLKFSMESQLVEENNEEERPTYGQMKYYVQSREIYESGTFSSGFLYQNTWDEGMTFTYSLSPVKNYVDLGGNALVEIYIGSKQLLNGKPFDVAKTQYPFSFKMEYLDLEQSATVPVYIDNNSRVGASGSITFKWNDKGYYDTEFDVTLNNGDINTKGSWSGMPGPVNVVYEDKAGTVATLRSATLDISGDPCLLYLSSEEGIAGPDKYDIMGEVPAVEWRYNYYMAFGSSFSAVTWIDGVRYDRSTADITPVIGGNWRVTTPKAIPGGIISECKVMLFGLGNAYYYGEIKVIE